MQKYLKPVYLGTYLNKNKSTSLSRWLCYFTFAYSISSKRKKTKKKIKRCIWKNLFNDNVSTTYLLTTTYLANAVVCNSSDKK